MEDVEIARIIKPLITPGIVNALLDCNNSSSPSEIEIEARIKKQLITPESINALLKCKSLQWTQSIYTEKRKISKTNRKCTYRQRKKQDGSTKIICKSSITKEDINDLWCVLHVSTETPVPSMVQALNSAEQVDIKRYRTIIEGHYVDIINDKSFFRVEVEVANSKLFDIQVLLRVVRRICSIMNSSFISYYDWKMVMHVASKQYENMFCIERRSYQKPQTMMINDIVKVSKYMELESSECVVTPKIDGVRKFIVIANDRVFSLGIMKDVEHIGNLNLDMGQGPKAVNAHYNDIIILDSEYVKAEQKYYVFDIAINDGIYVGNMPLETRLNMIEEIIPYIQTITTDANATDLEGTNLNSNMLLQAPGFASIIAKPYVSFDSFERLKSIYESFREQYNIDGIIFTYTTQDYMNPVLKWKTHSTVDLEVHILPDNNITLSTCDNKTIDTKIRNESYILNTLTSPSSYNLNSNLDSDSDPNVWEFLYDNNNKEFEAMRCRLDKPQGNSYEIVQKNMYYSVPGTLFSGKGFYLMRKYHNRVKKQLIIDANDNGATVFDVGTGQGGDIGKWKRTSHVYCIEPSIEATNEMRTRSNFDPSKVTVFNVPLRDFNIDNITEKIDIFTLFFCMNQFQENDWSVLQHVINAKGSKKCRLLAIALTDPVECNNECLTIKKYNNNPNMYNISIHDTRILNIDETPVNSIKLKKLMEECGMKQIKMDSLDDETFMTINERRLSFMYTLFVYKKDKN